MVARSVERRSTINRMGVRAGVLALAALAALSLPATAPAHLGDSGYRDDSADLPNPLLDRLDTLPAPALPIPAPGDPPPALPAMPGHFDLVGHEPLFNRGMNAAIAVYGHYVYVGYRSDGTHVHSGVQVVDVADPTKPKVVGEI